MMMGMMLAMVTFLALTFGGIIAAVLWVARQLGARQQPGAGALDILDQRFARGEINPEEYQARRRILLQR